jgi:hypothetical protein
VEILIPVAGICLLGLILLLTIYIVRTLRRERKLSPKSALAGAAGIALVAFVCAALFLVQEQSLDVASPPPSALFDERSGGGSVGAPAPTQELPAAEATIAPEPLPAAGVATSVPEPLPAAGAATSVPEPLPTAAQNTSLAQAVENEFARLSSGRILYNPPQEMTVEEKERVEVRITINPTSPLDKGLQGAGAPQVEPIQVANFMKVHLIGDAFDITPLSSEEQLVLGDEFTEWAWDVVPKRGGDHSLTIRVTARVKLQGYPDEQKDLDIIERQIRVQVTPLYSASSFFQDNKDWLLPSVAIPLLIAVGGWGWRRYIRKPNEVIKTTQPPIEPKQE